MQTDEYLQVARDSPGRLRMVERTQHGSWKKFAPGVHSRREDPKERRGSIRRTYYTGIVQTFAVDSLQKSSHPSWQETCIAQLLKHHQSNRIEWVKCRNEIEAGQKSSREILYFTTLLAVPIVVLFTFVANRRLVSVSPRCAASGDTFTII